LQEITLNFAEDVDSMMVEPGNAFLDIVLRVNAQSRVPTLFH